MGCESGDQKSNFLIGDMCLKWFSILRVAKILGISKGEKLNSQPLGWRYLSIIPLSYVHFNISNIFYIINIQISFVVEFNNLWSRDRDLPLYIENIYFFKWLNYVWVEKCSMLLVAT